MQYTQFGSAGVRVSRLALGLGLRGQQVQKLFNSDKAWCPFDGSEDASRLRVGNENIDALRTVAGIDVL